MNKDELSKMLGIKPKQVKERLVVEGRLDDHILPPRSLSNTVITTDEWDLSQGSELADKSGHHRTQQFNDLDRFDRQFLMTDFYAAAFHQEPEATNNCGNKVRQQFIDTLLQTPDYQVLHQSTKGNQFLSEKAAMEFCHEYSKVLKTIQDNPNPNAKRAKDLPRIACHNAINRALTTLNNEIEEMDALGKAAGMEPGADGKMDMERVAKSFNRVKNSPTLRRIINLAGRYRRTAQAKQRQKVTHGYDDMVGVETAGDIGRLLPVELASLGDELLELDTMRRIVDNQALCRQYKGVEKVGKGPIVVCVDESGSMSGNPIEQAKAFCLAMAWIAKHQNRHCMLFTFCAGRATRNCFLVPGKWNEMELLNWLENFTGGGTDLQVPLSVVPELWNILDIPRGKVDQIILTDAIVGVPSHLSIPYNEWKKKENVRTITIVIGSDKGQMEVVSDEVHAVGCIDVDSAAVSSCFSI